jgi:hypothetical protein
MLDGFHTLAAEPVSLVGFAPIFYVAPVLPMIDCSPGNIPLVSSSRVVFSAFGSASRPRAAVSLSPALSSAF